MIAKSPSPDSRRPKTALDEQFLSTAAEILHAQGITSDRAMSLALGRNADFINKVRRGLQSAPPEAWDALREKSPKASDQFLASWTDWGTKESAEATAAWESWATTVSSQDSVALISDLLERLIPPDKTRALAAVLTIHRLLVKENELLQNQLSDKERIIQLLLKPATQARDA